MKILSCFNNRIVRRIFIAGVFLAGYLAFQQISSSLRNFGFFGKDIIIEDVSEKIIITLSRKPGPNPRNRLFVRITGELSGAGVIHQIYDGDKKAVHAIGPGKVDLKIDENWQYPKCSLMYEPQGAVSGQLGIRYRFD